MNIYALVKAQTDKKMKHYSGFPPALQRQQMDTEYIHELPQPNFLIIYEKTDGTFLYRYTENLEFGGDTWHRNLEDAKHQAQFEFGELAWEVIPEGVDELFFSANRYKSSI